MTEFQPFPIKANKTGFFDYLAPWIRPEDAYEPLENAQVYRGVLSKRNGFTQLGNTLADGKPVMGIMNFINESTGNESLVVGTTKNAYLYDNGTNTFNALTSVSNSNFWQGNIPGGLTITVPTFWPNIAPLSVSITDGTSTITDDGAGNLSAAGNFAAGGTINYTTGSVTLNFVAALTNQSLKIACTSTNYFTGTIQNFFKWTNWQPTDPTTFVNSTSYLYMTNNVDPITLFDGTNLSRPIFYVNSAKTDYITVCLDIKVFKNRLLFIRPTLNSTSNALNQTIYFSALFNPFNVINDISGNGGQVTAATSDILQSFNFLRDYCIVRFSRSVFTFRFLGSDFNPFSFFKINSTKRTNCPYGSIEYDERETGIGSTGLTQTDGVNVTRFDLQIIDFYESEMSEKFYAQAFGQRYDNTQVTWTFFVSQSMPFPLVSSIAPGSDKALIYNFLENTWATYLFKTPMTCLGMYHVVNGETWAALTKTWESQDNPWFSYSNQELAPQLLAGDTTGHVYWMDDEDAVTDNGTSITSTVVTKRWNPFIDSGQKAQFGHIDFYYARNDDCTITLDFSIDNTNNVNLTRTFTLTANGTDGTAGSEFAMKRIYVNMIGEFLQMKMTSSSNARFDILGMILWASPSGRLTP